MLDEIAPGARAGLVAKVQDEPRFDEFGGILIDWDGCIAMGDRLRSEALAFLERHQERVAIVSNNSSDLPEDFSRVLRGRGIKIAPERIILAGAEAIAAAARRQDRRCLVLGSVKLTRLARRLGLSIRRDDADLVVLLRDTRFTYRKLDHAANALARGAALIVANPDMTHPGRSGQVVPETGALLAALSACVDRDKLKIEMIGKPGASLFWKACTALKIQPSQALMIGDNPATDIAGARALGMASLLVGPSFDFSAASIANALQPAPRKKGRP